MQLKMGPQPTKTERDLQLEAERAAQMSAHVSNILAKAADEGVTLALNPSGEGFEYASGPSPSGTLRGMAAAYKEELTTALGGDGEAQRRRALTPPPQPPARISGRHITRA